MGYIECFLRTYPKQSPIVAKFLVKPLLFFDSQDWFTNIFLFHENKRFFLFLRKSAKMKHQRLRQVYLS